MTEMKDEDINLIAIGYLEEENKYYATFKITSIDKRRRERVIQRQSMDFFRLNNRDCQVFEAGNELYITDYYQPNEFESYKSLIELAEKGIVPERVDPPVLESEIDICMIEQDAHFAIEYSAYSIEEIKEYYSLIEHFTNLKK